MYHIKKQELYALPLVALGVLCMYYQNVQFFVQSIDHCPIMSCDFKRYFLRQGQILFSTEKPVSGFFYGPVFALLMRPFAFLKNAANIWLGAQFVCLLSYLFLGQAMLDKRYSKMLFAFFSFFSIGVLHNVKWGAISGFVSVSVMAAVYFYLRHKQLVAACIMAFLVAVKFYPMYFLLPFFRARVTKFWVSFVLFSLLFFLAVPSVAFAPTRLLQFYQGIFSGISSTPFSIDENSQNIAAILSRFDFAWGTLIRWIAVCFCAFLVLYIRRTNDNKKQRVLLWFAIALLAVPFLPIPAWPHYFYAQAFAICVIADSSQAWFSAQKCRVLVLLLCVVALLLQSPIPVWMHEDWHHYAFWGYPCWSSAIGLSALSLSLVCRRS